ncbi:hypothetical protein ACIBL8_33330 [Streptomyces sp. NPDC050523]|uniref:LexA family protein n=1 Tax=Streptomyces sp. NPDC050523 TaxID=3365622 RepID=UPI00379F68E9
MANRRVDHLTSIQEHILRCMRESIGDRGETPTVKEIGQQLGMRSTASVHWHLRGRLRAGPEWAWRATPGSRPRPGGCEGVRTPPTDGRAYGVPPC